MLHMRRIFLIHSGTIRMRVHSIRAWGWREGCRERTKSFSATSSPSLLTSARLSGMRLRTGAEY